MTIPGRGDLMPSRRRRRGGRARRLAVAVAVLVVLAGGGYVGWRATHPRATPAPAAHRQTCHPSQQPAPAAPRTVRVSVLNTTLRTGLAASARRQLDRRGFHVTRVGNASPVVRSPAQVDYPSGTRGLAMAKALAEQLPGATQRETSAAGGLVLRIGRGWHGLASATAAAQARQRDQAAARPVCTR